MNCVSKYDLTDDPASIYDRKTTALRFDTIHDVLYLSLAQSHRPKWDNLALGERKHQTVTYKNRT